MTSERYKKIFLIAGVLIIVIFTKELFAMNSYIEAGEMEAWPSGIVPMAIALYALAIFLLFKSRK